MHSQKLDDALVEYMEDFPFWQKGPLTKPLPISCRLILRQARSQRSHSPPTAWELMVSCSISLLDGVFFSPPVGLHNRRHPEEREDVDCGKKLPSREKGFPEGENYYEGIRAWL